MSQDLGGFHVTVSWHAAVFPIVNILWPYAHLASELGIIEAQIPGPAKCSVNDAFFGHGAQVKQKV